MYITEVYIYFFVNNHVFWWVYHHLCDDTITRGVLKNLSYFSWLVFHHRLEYVHYYLSIQVADPFDQYITYHIFKFHFC